MELNKDAKLDALFSPAMRSAISLNAQEPGLGNAPEMEAGVDFKSKLESLRSMLAEDGLSLTILKMSLRDLKEQIRADPTISVEMLPEEIGLLSEALLRTEQIRIVAETQAKQRKADKKLGKAGVKKLSQEEIQELNSGELEF